MRPEKILICYNEPTGIYENYSGKTSMEAAAIDLGIPRETARLLTLQTALGAARMAIESDEEPATLRRRVTSPGGTTERAVAAFEEGGLRELFARALTAARDRSVELSRLLGGE